MAKQQAASKTKSKPANRNSAKSRPQLSLFRGSIIALGAGTLAASVIASQVLNTSFVFDAQAALWTVAGGGAATLLFGLFGAIAALNARPAQRLRSS